MSKTQNKTETVRSRINPKIKTKAEKILSAQGLNHSTFINLQYHNLVNSGGITISPNIPNTETENALREKRSTMKSYASPEELFEDLDKDE